MKSKSISPKMLEAMFLKQINDIKQEESRMMNLLEMELALVDGKKALVDEEIQKLKDQFRKLTEAA